MPAWSKIIRSTLNNTKVEEEATSALEGTLDALRNDQVEKQLKIKAAKDQKAIRHLAMQFNKDENAIRMIKDEIQRRMGDRSVSIPPKTGPSRYEQQLKKAKLHWEFTADKVKQLKERNVNRRVLADAERDEKEARSLLDGLTRSKIAPVEKPDSIAVSSANDKSYPYRGKTILEEGETEDKKLARTKALLRTALQRKTVDQGEVETLQHQIARMENERSGQSMDPRLRMAMNAAYDRQYKAKTELKGLEGAKNTEKNRQEVTRLNHVIEKEQTIIDGVMAQSKGKKTPATTVKPEASFDPDQGVPDMSDPDMSDYEIDLAQRRDDITDGFSNSIDELVSSNEPEQIKGWIKNKQRKAEALKKDYMGDLYRMVRGEQQYAEEALKKLEDKNRNNAVVASPLGAAYLFSGDSDASQAQDDDLSQYYTGEMPELQEPSGPNQATHFPPDEGVEAHRAAVGNTGKAFEHGLRALPGESLAIFDMLKDASSLGYIENWIAPTESSLQSEADLLTGLPEYEKGFKPEHPWEKTVSMGTSIGGEMALGALAGGVGGLTASAYKQGIKKLDDLAMTYKKDLDPKASTLDDPAKRQTLKTGAGAVAIGTAVGIGGLATMKALSTKAVPAAVEVAAATAGGSNFLMPFGMFIEKHWDEVANVLSRKYVPEVGDFGVGISDELVQDELFDLYELYSLSKLDDLKRAVPDDIQKYMETTLAGRTTGVNGRPDGRFGNYYKPDPGTKLHSIKENYPDYYDVIVGKYNMEQHPMLSQVLDTKTYSKELLEKYKTLDIDEGASVTEILDELGGSVPNPELAPVKKLPPLKKQPPHPKKKSIGEEMREDVTNNVGLHYEGLKYLINNF